MTAFAGIGTWTRSLSSAYPTVGMTTVHLRRGAVDDVDRDAVQGAVGDRVAEVGVQPGAVPPWRPTMRLMMAAELAATGALVIFWFHGLSSGNSWLPENVGTSRASELEDGQGYGGARAGRDGEMRIVQSPRIRRADGGGGGDHRGD